MPNDLDKHGHDFLKERKKTRIKIDKLFIFFENLTKESFGFSFQNQVAIVKKVVDKVLDKNKVST